MARLLATTAILAGLLISPLTQAAQVTLRLLDGQMGIPTSIPGRIHVRDATGKPQRARGLPFWHDHFVCDGRAELTLPPGRYTCEIERGPEFTAVRTNFTVETETTNFAFALSRFVNLAAEGWWSGETHVHRDRRDAELLMRAEDLPVAHFMTWWNKANLWANQPLPATVPVAFDRNRYYHPLGGEDERDGGALLYMDLAKPLEITGGAQHFPSSVVFARAAREAGAGWIDAEKPFWWDFPLWVAQGLADTVGIAHNHLHRSGVMDNEAWGRPRDRARFPGPQGNGRSTQAIYYHVLNCGLRLPPSAGSASGVLPNPVGYNRVYAWVTGEFTYAKWRKALLEGRSFVSNGPLLRARANGQVPGTVFKTNGPLSITLDWKLDARDPIAAIELVRNGRVDRINPPARFSMSESGWFLVRAIADVTNTFRFASTAPWYVELDSQAMKPRADSAQFFVDWCRERMARLNALTEVTPPQKEELLGPWRQAEGFWQEKVRSGQP